MSEKLKTKKKLKVKEHLYTFILIKINRFMNMYEYAN